MDWLEGFSRTDYILAVGLAWIIMILTNIQRDVRALYGIGRFFMSKEYPDDM
jgi:hypothetical protein